MMGAGQRVRFQTSHINFSVGFSLILYAVCNALNIGRLAGWFFQQGRLDLWSLAAYLLAGLCVFIAFFTLFAHRRIIKPFAILLASVSAPVTYFISKYNVAIDGSMIRNVIHTDRTEIGQLLSLQMIPYVVFLMVLPTVIILFVGVTFQPGGRYLIASLKLILTAVLIALSSLYLNFAGIHRAGNVSNKYIVYTLVPINFIASTISVFSESVAAHLPSRRKEIRISGRVSSPGNLAVVLAIGESSRRKSFSLYGYERRNTNPVLQKVSGLHLLNGTAKRGSTLSALPEILRKNGVELATLVSRLGIPTSCYVNYTLYDHCAAVGETKVTQCGHGGRCFDEDVIPLLERNLEGSVPGYRFVVLHLGGGSHGPRYFDRIPPEFQRFLPTCNDADVANQCTNEQLYNSYDNTILYVDHVLGEIIQRLDHSGAPYVFIYVSDHGESLMEEGRMFHGMPPGIPLPPEQAQVPLIVKASVPISIIERAEYPQADIFDTVLDLFSVQTPLSDGSGSFIRR